MNCAGNQAVDFVLFQHQRAENDVVFQLLAGNRFGHPLALTQFDQTSDVAFANHIRIDDFDTSAQLDALSGSNAVDLIRVTQQDTGRNTAFCADCCGFNGTRLVTFRQNDAFTRFARQLGQLVAEGRRRQAAATFGGRGQRLDPVSVNVVGNVFLNFLNALVIVNRNFEVEALQAQGGLPGVGVHHKDRQAGRECTFAQLADARVHFVSTGQQQRADFNAVHGGEAGGDQNIRTVCGSHQQRTGTEVFEHVRDAARAEGDRLHAAGVDVTFVDDGGIQVASHIDRTRCDQIEAPRYRAQNRQRAARLQLSRIDLHDFRFGRVIEDFRQIGTGTTLFVNRCVQLVDDNTGNVGVFRAAEAVAGQLDTFVQLFLGVGTLRHHEDDFRVQRFGDFEVQRLSKLMFTGRDQTFNQHHFCILSRGVIVGDDLFHQHIFLVAGQQRLDVAHLQRLGGRKA